MKGPLVVKIIGPAGSGKTMLAQKIAELVGTMCNSSTIVENMDFNKKEIKNWLKNPSADVTILTEQA